MKYTLKLIFILLSIGGFGCQTNVKSHNSLDKLKSHETFDSDTNFRNKKVSEILVGAERITEYVDLLRSKKVGLVVNHTSMVKQAHLVDTLRALDIKVKKIFAPEHGIRGLADAGEVVSSGIDSESKIPIISLYGDRKKPSNLDLEGIDIVVFDIQDVGVRFYTYISSLSLVMEACAENRIPVIILDRPNPNIHYISGPVLKKEFTSFVGMHPIPVVYGLSIGEYGSMVNGQSWLKNGIKADLTVIWCENYTRDSLFEPPILPSPNLSTLRSILLYPSLCFFEGTEVNAGRGTDTPFEVFGSPNSTYGSYYYTPKPNAASQNPKNNGQLCRGKSLNYLKVDSLSKNTTYINLSYLINMYEGSKGKEQFFKYANFFDKLAGSDKLRQQIESGISEEMILKSWENDLEEYKKLRHKYMYYK